MPIRQNSLTEKVGLKRNEKMKHYNKYERIIAVSERSAGNESVGDMWVETKSFDKNTPVSEIIEWGKSTGGRLIISIDESTVDPDF
jgi:hypothetical protein